MENKDYTFGSNSLESKQAKINACFKTDDVVKSSVNELLINSSPDLVKTALNFDIEKGGVGSGRTKSGKHILRGGANILAHKNFTKEDHQDAVEYHLEQAMKNKDNYKLRASHNEDVKSHKDAQGDSAKSEKNTPKGSEGEKDETSKQIDENPHKAGHDLIDSTEKHDEYMKRANEHLKGQMYTTKGHMEASKKALHSMHKDGLFKKKESGDVKKSEDNDLQKAFDILGLK